jgi:hypothetical protein
MSSLLNKTSLILDFLGQPTYAIDGKRIRQPIAGADGKTRFVGLVSVFAHQQGITVDLASLSETENSELSVVQYLIEKLQLEGAVLSLDALHAQKNGKGNYR